MLCTDVCPLNLFTSSPRHAAPLHDHMASSCPRRDRDPRPGPHRHHPALCHVHALVHPSTRPADDPGSSQPPGLPSHLPFSASSPPLPADRDRAASAAARKPRPRAPLGSPAGLGGLGRPRRSSRTTSPATRFGNGGLTAPASPLGGGGGGGGGAGAGGREWRHGHARRVSEAENVDDETWWQLFFRVSVQRSACARQ